METKTSGLDPAFEEILKAWGNPFAADLDAMPLNDALRIARPAPKPASPPGNSKDMTINAADGAPIRIRLYYPTTSMSGLPMLVHLHGGGFVSGSIEMDDVRCDRLAREAQCVVASVDYRLAPEHPFPVPIEDSFAAWKWLTSHAGEIGVDPKRCAVSGSSAGGHLSIGVTLLARKRDVQMPIFHLLTYPVVDPSMGKKSYNDFVNGPFMTAARMAWYWKQYGIGGQHKELWDPLSAPAIGLPPAHVITAEFDVLRDEGEAYADHLRAAGIPATVERYPGMIHGFISVVADHAVSQAALASSAAMLRRAFVKN